MFIVFNVGAEVRLMSLGPFAVLLEAEGEKCEVCNSLSLGQSKTNVAGTFCYTARKQKAKSARSATLSVSVSLLFPPSLSLLALICITL